MKSRLYATPAVKGLKSPVPIILVFHLYYQHIKQQIWNMLRENVLPLDGDACLTLRFGRPRLKGINQQYFKIIVDINFVKSE